MQRTGQATFVYRLRGLNNRLPGRLPFAGAANARGVDFLRQEEEVWRGASRGLSPPFYAGGQWEGGSGGPARIQPAPLAARFPERRAMRGGLGRPRLPGLLKLRGRRFWPGGGGCSCERPS